MKDRAKATKAATVERVFAILYVNGIFSKRIFARQDAKAQKTQC